MRAAMLLAVCIALAGCSSMGTNPAVLAMSAEEALAEGKALMAQGRYEQARSHLIHAFEIEPNSVNGREGLLLAADSLFESGGGGNWVKSQARYRDFLNRFPTSERAAYAQFRFGQSIARRMEKPDRDMSISQEALDAFNDVQRFYPTSEFAEQARVEMTNIEHHLARHELIVGRFYLRYQRYGTAFAAIGRLEGILEDYPDFPGTDEVLLYLFRAYSQSETEELKEKARQTSFRLRTQFPDSRYTRKLPKDEGEANDAQELDSVVSADGGL